MRCLLTKGRPHLFRIFPNPKVYCLNLEAYQVEFLFQVVSDLLVDIEHIVHRDGEIFPESLLTLAQPNCYRHDGSLAFYLCGRYKNVNAV